MAFEWTATKPELGRVRRGRRRDHPERFRRPGRATLKVLARRLVLLQKPDEFLRRPPFACDLVAPRAGRDHQRMPPHGMRPPCRRCGPSQLRDPWVDAATLRGLPRSSWRLHATGAPWRISLAAHTPSLGATSHAQPALARRRLWQPLTERGPLPSQRRGVPHGWKSGSQAFKLASVHRLSPMPTCAARMLPKTTPVRTKQAGCDEFRQRHSAKKRETRDAGTHPGAS